ncbi:MAG: hypothetical protein LASZOEIN_000086 [Candidatus Fervidibacter sp.]|jgi:hypothetical protein
MAWKRRIVFGLIIVALVIGGLVWWWNKQAPYRVARAFLDALQEGDIERLYALSDPMERHLLKLTPDNFRSAYNLLLKSFVEKWRWKKLRPHPEARLYRFTLPPDCFPIYITYEAKDGRRREELIIPRWTEEGWRVSLGRFIYFLYLQPDEIPKATKREVLLRLLKSGFYAFPTERGNIYSIPIALDWLEAEMAKERR